MQSIGDGTSENTVGLRVKGTQSTGGHVYWYFTGQKQVLVENEFQLLIRLATTLDHTGAGVKLQPAAGLQIQFRLHGAAPTLRLGNFLVRQRS